MNLPEQGRGNCLVAQGANYTGMITQMARGK